MTSEVALMNRMAVALAADSATTVSYVDSEDGQRKRRYFKGANKIFNLSNSKPVGLMINGSASLQRMPWEVIVKQYRESRGAKSFDRITDYSNDFFIFLKSKQVFPSEYQEKRLIDGISTVAGTIVQSILREDDVQSETDVDRRKQMSSAHLEDRRVLIEQAPYISEAAKKCSEDVQKNYLKKIEEEFKTGNLYKLAKGTIDLDAVYAMAARAFFTERFTAMESTGVVVAGYGESELFPCLEQYNCYGVFLGTVLYNRLDNSCKSINFDAPSEIVPIAQDVMAYTFMFGASIASIVQFQDHFQEEANGLLKALVDAGHLAQNIDTTALLQAASDKFMERNRRYVNKDASRLRRVIGMMPVSELADLAETLVSLESLKERTTVGSESVSGPIDVAVITKGDGFIWVKRKHYFDPALNLRFVAKKNAEANQ